MYAAMKYHERNKKRNRKICCVVTIIILGILFALIIRWGLNEVKSYRVAHPSLYS